MRRLILTTLILLVTLSGCGTGTPSEAELAGSWEIEEEDMAGTLSLNPDKSFVADTSDGVLSGTWRLEGDRLVGTVEDSTIFSISKGYSWSNVVKNVSENRLALQNRSGEVERYRRVE